jgi:hypothetical protein
MVDPVFVLPGLRLPPYNQVHLSTPSHRNWLDRPITNNRELALARPTEILNMRDNNNNKFNLDCAFLLLKALYIGAQP